MFDRGLRKHSSEGETLKMGVVSEERNQFHFLQQLQVSPASDPFKASIVPHCVSGNLSQFGSDCIGSRQAAEIR